MGWMKYSLQPLIFFSVSQISRYKRIKWFKNQNKKYNGFETHLRFIISYSYFIFVTWWRKRKNGEKQKNKNNAEDLVKDLVADVSEDMTFRTAYLINWWRAEQRAIQEVDARAVLYRKELRYSLSLFFYKHIISICSWYPFLMGYGWRRGETYIETYGR